MDNFEEVMKKLVKIQLFSDFKAEDENDCRILKMVYENMTIENFSAGQVIIKEGDKGDTFYILYEGSVKVLRNTPAGDKIALADLSSDKHVFFGETALISQDTRSATVQADKACKCISLSSRKFLEICNKEPLLGYRVILQLARKMAKTIREVNTDKATLYEALFNEIESGI